MIMLLSCMCYYCLVLKCCNSMCMDRHMYAVPILLYVSEINIYLSIYLSISLFLWLNRISWLIPYRSHTAIRAHIPLVAYPYALAYFRHSSACPTYSSPIPYFVWFPAFSHPTTKSLCLPSSVLMTPLVTFFLCHLLLLL